ncbi:hypothetical protein GY45DRAFT_938273 [Cubamyces sp. BRFM 1775]|nr:hypothetical protein GY45DRAFT_938273 [Cubamyces sp. BRFM 1775]
MLTTDDVWQFRPSSLERFWQPLWSACAPTSLFILPASISSIQVRYLGCLRARYTFTAIDPRQSRLRSHEWHWRPLWNARVPTSSLSSPPTPLRLLKIDVSTVFVSDTMLTADELDDPAFDPLSGLGDRSGALALQSHLLRRPLANSSSTLSLSSCRYTFTTEDPRRFRPWSFRAVLATVP